MGIKNEHQPQKINEPQQQIEFNAFVIEKLRISSYFVCRNGLPRLDVNAQIEQYNIITFHKNMKLFAKLKSFVYKSDLLCSRTLLRVKGEPQFQTLTGGLVSITIMILLAALFYNKVIDTLNKVLITSSITTINEEDPSSFNLTTIDEGIFMFGVEVWHHDLNSDKRYFDVVLKTTIYDYGQPADRSVQYPLEPCRVDHWDGFPQVQGTYQHLRMKDWMCLPKNMSYQIKGKYASKQSKTLDVAVKKCTNNTFDARPCASQQEISQMFIDNEGAMFFTIYFINPLINPENQDYLNYYLEDSNYIAFSAFGGEESRLFLQDFQIDTDQSILPFTDIKTQTGGVVSSSPLKSTYTQVIDTYAIFIFYKSPISLTITRSFQKLDDVFSYIGGLFGTIMIIFFLVSAYNTHKFEINISGYLYASEHRAEKREKKYNFFYFLGQLLFGLLRNFGISSKWEILRYYHKTREQALKQLDVLFLFKRINFLERSLSLLFTENQLKGLHLANHTTISEAVRIRKNYRLKPKLKGQIEELRKKHSEKHLNQRDPFDSNVSCQVFKDQKANSKKSSENQDPNNDSFNSEDYNSDQSSDGEDDKILDSVIELKNESDKNPISKKIWTNLDSRLKHLIPIASKPSEGEDRKTEKEQFQEHKIVNLDEQSNPNLFLFQDPNIDDMNQGSQNQNNFVFTKQTFQKLRGLNTKSSMQIQPKSK